MPADSRFRGRGPNQRYLRTGHITHICFRKLWYRFPLATLSFVSCLNCLNPPIIFPAEVFNYRYLYQRRVVASQSTEEAICHSWDNDFKDAVERVEPGFNGFYDLDPALYCTDTTCERSKMFLGRLHVAAPAKRRASFMLSSPCLQWTMDQFSHANSRIQTSSSSLG